MAVFGVKKGYGSVASGISINENTVAESDKSVKLLARSETRCRSATGLKIGLAAAVIAAPILFNQGKAEARGNFWARVGISAGIGALDGVIARASGYPYGGYYGYGGYGGYCGGGYYRGGIGSLAAGAAGALSYGITNSILNNGQPAYGLYYQQYQQYMPYTQYTPYAAYSAPTYGAPGYAYPYADPPAAQSTSASDSFGGTVMPAPVTVTPGTIYLTTSHGVVPLKLSQRKNNTSDKKQSGKTAKVSESGQTYKTSGLFGMFGLFRQNSKCKASAHKEAGTPVVKQREEPAAEKHATTETTKTVTTTVVTKTITTSEIEILPAQR
jgi:hypothetical protein